jgi:hypothetical protein
MTAFFIITAVETSNLTTVAVFGLHFAISCCGFTVKITSRIGKRLIRETYIDYRMLLAKYDYLYCISAI